MGRKRQLSKQPEKAKEYTTDGYRIKRKPTDKIAYKVCKQEGHEWETILVDNKPWSMRYSRCGLEVWTIKSTRRN